MDTSALQPNVVSALTNASYSHVSDLSVDCPLLRMGPQELEHARDGPVIWAVLEALRPAPEVRRGEGATWAAAGAVSRCDELSAPCAACAGSALVVYHQVCRM